MLAQFHNDADNPPAFAFENQSTAKKGGYWIHRDSYILGYNEQLKLIDKSEMYGKWNDILVNQKMDTQKRRFF